MAVSAKKNRVGLGRKAALKWALSDPLCHEILARMTERPSCAIEIAEELGSDVDREHVAYRIRKMAGNYGDAPLIELVETAQTDDRRRNLYRAIARGVLDTETFKKMSGRNQEALTLTAVNMITADMESSVMSDAINQHPAKTLLRMPTPVDEQGYKEIAAELLATLERIKDIQAASANRIAKSGEPTIDVHSYLMAFPPR